MKIFRIGVRFSEQGDWHVTHAIHSDQHQWLVCRWLENKEQGVARPTKLLLIPEGSLHLSPVSSCKFVLPKPIPEAVLRGDEKGEFLEHPEPEKVLVPSHLVWPN